MVVTEPVDEDQFTAAGEPPVDDDMEVVDALPVPDVPRAEQEPPPPGGPTPAPLSRAGAIVAANPAAVQAAAVAVTGFAAGAVTVAAVRRRRLRKVTKANRKRRKAFGEIRASRSFLVDVHLLDRT